MTRTTDDLNPEPAFQPLGPKVTPPPPPAPDWKQIPGAAPGVGIGSDGRLSTRIPGNTI